MAKMRRAIEEANSMPPPKKRKSILKNAVHPSRNAAAAAIAEPLTKQRRQKMTPDGTDHSTPNHIGGGFQTKIPQFLKGSSKDGGTQGIHDGRQPLTNVNGNKLDDRYELFSYPPF